MIRMTFCATPAAWRFVLFGIASTAAVCGRAATIEHHLVVAPDLTTDVHYNESAVANIIRSTLLAPLPEMTLSAGDVVRVSVQLTGGQYFARPATPNGSSQSTHFELNIANEEVFPHTFGSGVNGSIIGEVFDRAGQVVQRIERPSSHGVRTTDRYLWGTVAAISDGNIWLEPLVPATVSKVAFEFTVPTEVSTFLGTRPFATQTFAMNRIELNFEVTDPANPPSLTAAAFAVPEPGSAALALAAVLALLGRRAERWE